MWSQPSVAAADGREGRLPWRQCRGPTDGSNCSIGRTRVSDIVIMPIQVRQIGVRLFGEAHRPMEFEGGNNSSV